jgi:hypothetical protein
MINSEKFRSRFCVFEKTAFKVHVNLQTSRFDSNVTVVYNTVANAGFSRTLFCGQPFLIFPNAVQTDFLRHPFGTYNEVK